MNSYGERDPIIFALQSSKRFGDRLGATGKVFERRFDDGEPYVRPDENVRGADVFVIQSLYNQKGDEESLEQKMIKLLIFCNAAYHASTARITCVIPYLALGRQERKTESRAPLSSRLFADLLEAAHADRMLTMDPHTAAVQSMYNFPSDILVPFSVLAENIYPLVKDERKVAIIGPDDGAHKERVRPLERRLLRDNPHPSYELVTGFTPKIRKGSDTETYDPIVTSSLNNAFVIMPDDETVKGTSLRKSARRVKEKGAKYVLAIVTHCKANARYARLIQDDSAIDSLWVTDTICKPEEFYLRYPKFHEVSVAGLFRKAIENIHNDESVSQLF